MIHHPMTSHLLVALQFASIGVGLFPFHTPSGSLVWLWVAALGGALGVYTLMHNRLGNFAVYPEPLEDAHLITSGPYRWVRHPMYSSLVLAMIGFAMFNGGLANQLSLLTLLLAVMGKMHREETYLRTKFSRYEDYARERKRLVPGVF